MGSRTHRQMKGAEREGGEDRKKTGESHEQD